MDVQGNQDGVEERLSCAIVTTEALARLTGVGTALQRQEHWVFILPTLASHWMQDASEKGP